VLQLFTLSYKLRLFDKAAADVLFGHVHFFRSLLAIRIKPINGFFCLILLSLNLLFQIDQLTNLCLGLTHRVLMEINAGLLLIVFSFILTVYFSF